MSTSDKINVNVFMKLSITMGNAIMVSVRIILTISISKYQRKYPCVIV